MEKTLPMLSGDGFLTDPDLIMSRLYMHAFLTDHSQSNIYQGDVVSIQYILSESGDDPVVISAGIEKGLTELYSKYFTHVEVSFQQIDSAKAGLSEAHMVFNLSVRGEMDGKVYELSKTVQTDESGTMKKFIEAF